LSPFFDTFLSSGGLLLGKIVPFLFVLTVVVFVHEMGHYLVGRWCGIGVKAFSIGFGPELIGFNDRHGTRWKLCAVPLGGYVKFVGDMNATSTPDAQEMDRLTPEEKKVAFHTQPVWKRALTVFAGPAFNFLLTIVVFAAFFSIYGRYVLEPTIAQVQENSPAARAGFLAGDRFVSIDGVPIETFDDVQRYVSGRAGDPMVFVVRRADREVSLNVTPELRTIEDRLGNVQVGAIGVMQTTDQGTPRLVEYSVPAAVGEAVVQTGHIIQGTGRFLKRLVGGREDRCQLGGPIKIADMAGRAAKEGMDLLIQLIAFLSVGIGILNLLPIPPLDGGHLAFYAIEAVIRRPVSERTMEAVYRVGFLLVMSFMVFVFWNDIFGC
jgi:regulator of sigma E protease